MLSKTLSSAAIALVASSLASAQTFTECNPLKKTCPPDPAFGSNGVNCDFTKGPCKAFTSAIATNIEYKENLGAVFKIESDKDAPTIATGKYIFFGKVEVVAQVAPGIGIVTSAVLQSDDLDEIDWEWLGGDNTQVQSNYFSKGDTSTYDRVSSAPVASPNSQFHTYTIDWTPKSVQWIIDGVVVRTLTYEAAKGGAAFPQTPMQVKLGTWVAGRKDAPLGTVQWGGGYTDFTQAPFLAYYKSIKIVDYAGGSAPTTQAIKEYSYGDNTGTWQSIKVVPGNADDSKVESQVSSSQQQSSTKAPDSSSKAAPKSESSSSEANSTSVPSTTMTTTTSTSINSTSSGPPNSATSGSARITSATETSAAATRATVSATSSPVSAATTTVGGFLLAGLASLMAHLLL